MSVKAIFSFGASVENYATVKKKYRVHRLLCLLLPPNVSGSALKMKPLYNFFFFKNMREFTSTLLMSFNVISSWCSPMYRHCILSVCNIAIGVHCTLIWCKFLGQLGWLQSHEILWDFYYNVIVLWFHSYKNLITLHLSVLFLSRLVVQLGSVHVSFLLYFVGIIMTLEAVCLVQNAVVKIKMWWKMNVNKN